MSASPYHDDEMITQKEAAARLGYSVQHFRTLRIPSIGKHKGKRYRWGTVRKWIEQCEAASLAEMMPPPRTYTGRVRKYGGQRPLTYAEALAKNPPEKRRIPPIEEALSMLRTGSRKKAQT